MGQLTVGELIEKLQDVPKDAQVYLDGERSINPTIHSYRGIYVDGAFNPVTPGSGGRQLTPKSPDYGSPVPNWCTAGMLLDECQRQLHTYMFGWKGGEYKITPNTKLWIATEGRDSGVKLVGLRVLKGSWEGAHTSVVLKTLYLHHLEEED